MIEENNKDLFESKFKENASKSVDHSFSSKANAIGQKGKKIAQDNEQLVVKTAKRGLGCIAVTVLLGIIIFCAVAYFIYNALIK